MRTTAREHPSGEPGAYSTSNLELGTQNEGVEDMHTQVEMLGRQRPEVFKTIWHELGFCFSLLASMLMAVCFPIRPVEDSIDDLLPRSTSLAVSILSCQSWPQRWISPSNLEPGQRASFL
jgi:hypothetical protein